MSIVEKPSLEDYLKMKGSLRGAIEELKKNGYSEMEISREYNLPLHWVMIYGSGRALRSKYLFSEIINHYKAITDRKSLKGKRTESIRFLREVPLPYKEKIQFLMGELSNKPIGVGYERIIDALRILSNKSRNEMNSLIEDYGDIGDIAYFLAKDRDKETLLADEVYHSINLIAETSGTHKKISAIVSLFEVATKEEAKYIAWLLRKRVYLGLNTETIISAVGEYAGVNADTLSNVCLLRGTIEGLLIAQQGDNALNNVKIVPGTFINCMLAQLFDSGRVRYPCRADVKYDGARIQVHKSGDNIAFFSRTGHLQNGIPFTDAGYVTNVFKQVTGATSFIAEFEFMARGSDGEKLPIGDTHSALTNGAENLEIRVFDLLYCDGHPMLNWDFRSRFRKLNTIFPAEIVVEGDYFNSPQELMAYYDSMVEKGKEGIMVKDLDGKYYPSKRSNSWMKLKKNTDTIDAVIVKAKYGHGRKSGVYSSFRLAVKHPSKKTLYEIGDFSNLSESDLEVIARSLTVLSKDKEGVRVKPELVVEVITYEIIQSNQYSSGFSLRSPRLVRIRWDKKVQDIDTIIKIKDMYKAQVSK